MTRDERVTRLLSGRWNADSLAVFVPKELCRCGAMPTDCTEDGTRWAMVVIAPSVATIKHVADGVYKPHDCGTSKCVVTIHDCIESGCVGEKAGPL